MDKFLFPAQYRTIVALACGFLFFGMPLLAQEDPLHAPDGGTRETVQSITILPSPNAPFSAVVVTVLTKVLPDGSQQIVKNHRTVARDSSGRVFQERRYFSPTGDTQPTRISQLEYQDPNRHELYVCLPVKRTCEVYKSYRPTTVVLQPAGKLPNGAGILTREDLGHKTIEDLDVVGSRETTTIDAGVVGNEKPLSIVKDFWYSPHLGINVTTTRFDPRVSSLQSFVVENINLSEPDPKIFEPPADYRMIKMDE